MDDEGHDLAGAGGTEERGGDGHRPAGLVGVVDEQDRAVPADVWEERGGRSLRATGR